jgi:hypothetical protein
MNVTPVTAVTLERIQHDELIAESAVGAHVGYPACASTCPLVRALIAERMRRASELGNGPQERTA